ncbi:MAG: hypothetical protein KatS3mg102_1359 [Planctomycetota bacterium]|nr:MAG: hypothetical protein KatS3mg102_1359 [Planctomycetota bacterium]
MRPLLVVGDAPEEYPQVFRDPQVVAAPAEYAHAPPAALAACGLRAWFAGVRQRPESVLPLYLRPPLGV